MRAGRATDALKDLVDWGPDVVVLDLGLPDIDGADVLRDAASGDATVPVIVATARDDEAEIVRLLDAGADDYVVKPYSAGPARGPHPRGAAAGRTAEAGRARRARSVGDLGSTPVRREATLAGEPLELARKEFDLLALPGLAARRGGRPSASCWPRCGASPSAAPTRRSTCTCRGCGASWARPPSEPALPPHRAGCGGEAGRPAD